MVEKSRTQTPDHGDVAVGGRRVDAVSLLVMAPWLVLAAIPAMSVYRAIQERWTPVSDWAMIGAWSWDSLAWPPPLLGMPTTLSQHTSEAASHPGPLLFWVLAIPTRLFGAPGYGIVIGSAFINIVFLAITGLALRSIGGRWLSLGGAVVVGAMMMSLGADAWRDAYNPLIAILPMLAAMVTAWAVICGKHRWLVAFVGAGSFAAQTHVSYLLAVGMLVIVLVVHLATGVFADEEDRPARPSAKVLISSLLVGLACWSGPLFDQFFRSGNLWRLLVGGTGSQDQHGLRFGFDRLIDAVSVPPSWWSGVPSGLLGHPAGLRTAIGIAVMVFLMGLLVLSWRRDRAVTGSLAAALVAAIGGILTSALIPIDPFSVITRNNRYLWVPIGLFIWIAVGHAAVRLLVTPALRPADSHRVPAPVPVLVASVLITLATVAMLVSSMSGPGPKREAGSYMYGSIRQHAQALEDLNAPNGYVLMMDSDTLPNTLLFQGLVGQLAISGVQVTVPRNFDPSGIFTSYQRRHSPTGREDAVLLMRSGDAIDDPPAGFCEVSRYNPAEPWPVYEGYDGNILYTGNLPSAIFLGPSADDPAARRVVDGLCARAAAD